MRFFPACLLAASLAACGQPSSAPAAATFDIHVTGSTMSPSNHLTATKGQTITMSVTCDKDEEIHLHGFDRKFECKGGRALTQTFAADRTGNFEIEIEDTSTHLGELDVTPS